LPSVALAVAKSRSTSLARRFKSLHPVAQGVSVAIVAFAAISPLLFGGGDPDSGTKKRDMDRVERDRRAATEADSDRRQPAKTLDYGQIGEIKPARGDVDRPALLANDTPNAKPKCNEGFSIADCQPSTVPAPKTAAVEQASLAASPTIADLRRAVKEREFDRALSIGEPLANSGEREAQFIVGMIALKGQGRPQHLPTAFKWIKKAAEKEFPEAQAVLGNMYQNGDADGGENVGEAVRLYLKAAEQNNPRGQFWLGKAFEKGVPNVLKKNVKRAGDLFRLAKAQDFPGAAEALETLRKSGQY
jgi:eukaryotic-like serine/threonine-protein kinase